MEENKLLFVWNDPEALPPIPGQRPPREKHCFDGEWSERHVDKLSVHTRCRVANPAGRAKRQAISVRGSHWLHRARGVSACPA